MKLKSLLPSVLLFGLVFVVFVGNLFWVHLNKMEPFYDEAGHVTLAYIHANVLRGEFPANGVSGFFKLSTYYPPLLYWVGGVVNLIFGFDYHALEYMSVVIYVFAVLSVWFWVIEITRKKSVALVSAALFALFPHIWEQSRHFMLDLPLTLLVTLSWGFLARYSRSKSTKSFICFCLFACLAQMTKWYAFLFELVPVLLIVFPVMVRDVMSKSLEKKLKYLVSFGICLLLVAPWYLINFNDLINSSVLYSRPDYGDPTNILSLTNLLSYVILLINYQIFLWGLVLLVLALVYFVNRQIAWKKIVLWQIVVTFTVFTFFIGNKNLRYVMPLLPVIAFVVAQFLVDLRGKFKWVSFLLIVTYVGFGLIFYLVSSFGIPVDFSKQYSVRLFHGVDSVFIADFSSKYVNYRFVSDRWSLNEPVNDIWELTEHVGAKILVVANNPYVSVAGLRVFSVADLYYLNFDEVPFDITEDLSKIDINQLLKTYHFLLVQEKNFAPTGQINFKNLEVLRSFLLAGKTRDFVMVREYTLPSGDKLYLLRNDVGVNVLNLNFNGDKLVVTRRPAVARVYFQLQDVYGYWREYFMGNFDNELEIPLRDVKTVRVDYPNELLKTSVNDGEWYRSESNQFDKLSSEVDKS